MLKRVRAAYHKFAAEKGFELIPTGDAIALYRKNTPPYKVLSSQELAKYKNPDLPPMANDIVGRDFWKKQTDGSMKLDADRIHLNFKGEYLQACVWYMALFNEDISTIRYEHPRISKDECQALVSAAGEAFKYRK